MNLEEASRHPDRLAKEAADAAYSSLYHIHEIVDRQYGNKLNDDQKLHVVSALEEACRAYKAAKAAESSIVNSGFFPEEVAVTPETAEPKPEPEPDEQEALVHCHVIRHGYPYKMNSLDRIALKFVAPVDLSVRAKGRDRACRVFGLETSNDDVENDYCVYALVTYADTPVISYFHKRFSEFSEHEKEQLIDMMKQGNAGFFHDEKLGADPLPDDVAVTPDTVYTQNVKRGSHAEWKIPEQTRPLEPVQPTFVCPRNGSHPIEAVPFPSERKDQPNGSDDPYMVEDEAFVRSYIRAKGSMYDTSIAVQFSRDLPWERKPLHTA